MMDFSVGCGVPALFLAPMQDITDADFMNIVADRGAPDVFVCEYIRIHENYQFEPHIMRALLNPPAGKPIVAQFIGEDEICLARAAIELAKYPQITMLDFNMGCPAPKIYKKNAGGGLLRDLKKIDSVLRVLRENWGGILSVKMRSGFADSANFEDILGTVLLHSPDFVTVHARTVKQLYRGVPDYGVISRAVKIAGKVPVVANGDILSAERAAEVLDATKCTGLMVGRHAVRNPWIFRQIRQKLAGTEIFRPTLADVREYVERLVEKIRGEGTLEKRADARLKKFLNFIGVGVEPTGEFLFKMRRALGLAEVLAVCDAFMVRNGNAAEPFAFEPYANLRSRPNHEGD